MDECLIELLTNFFRLPSVLELMLGLKPGESSDVGALVQGQSSQYQQFYPGPSFCDLLVSSYRGSLPINRSHHSNHSISASISLPTIAHTPQASITGDSDLLSSALPSPQDTTGRQLPDYSYYDRGQTNLELQTFRFPQESEQSQDYTFPNQGYSLESRRSLPKNVFNESPDLPSTSSPSRLIHHVKSLSSTTTFNPDYQTQPQEEELIYDVQKIISLSNNINHNISDIYNGYANLIAESKPRYSPSVDTLEGHAVDAQGIEKQIKREAFKNFMGSIKAYTLDSLLFDLEADMKAVQRLKDYKASLTKEQALTSSEFKQMKKETKAPVSKPKQDLPKRSKQTDTSPKRRKSELYIGGDVLHLNINKPVLETNAHMSPIQKSFLNKEFLIKKDIQCEQCGSKETPEWRKGPPSCKTLCNACGIYFAKLTKKYDAEEAEKIMSDKKAAGTPHERKVA